MIALVYRDSKKQATVAVSGLDIKEKQIGFCHPLDQGYGLCERRDGAHFSVPSRLGLGDCEIAKGQVKGTAKALAERNKHAALASIQLASSEPGRVARRAN